VGLVDGDKLVVLGPPAGAALDFAAHKAVCDLIAGLVNDGLVDGVHDVADGGVALALAEMAVRSGVGFRVRAADPFVESPSRVVVSVAPDRLQDVHQRHVDAGVAGTFLGEAGGDRLVIDGVLDLAVDEAANAWRDRLPGALGAGTAQ
jgi:phosphoribosylformylglycinamidine synthase